MDFESVITLYLLKMPLQGSEIVWESLLINQESLEKDLSTLGENIWEERKRRNRATPQLIKIWESFLRNYNADETYQMSSGRDFLTLGAKSQHMNHSYRELKNENLDMKDF